MHEKKVMFVVELILSITITLKEEGDPLYLQNSDIETHLSIHKHTSLVKTLSLSVDRRGCSIEGPKVERKRLGVGMDSDSVTS